MATYTFDFNLAQTVLSEMDGITKNIVTMLSDLDADVRRSLAEWENSDAQEAYAISKAKWDAAAAKMPVYLGQAGVALQAVADAYHGGEKSGVALWSGS